MKNERMIDAAELACQAKVLGERIEKGVGTKESVTLTGIWNLLHAILDDLDGRSRCLLVPRRTAPAAPEADIPTCKTCLEMCHCGVRPIHNCAHA